MNEVDTKMIDCEKQSRNEVFTLNRDVFEPDPIDNTADPLRNYYQGPAIFKSELCLKYLPDLSAASASRAIRTWVQNTPELLAELKETNYNKHSHILTPKQISIFFKHLGKP